MIKRFFLVIFLIFLFTFFFYSLLFIFFEKFVLITPREKAFIKSSFALVRISFLNIPGFKLSLDKFFLDKKERNFFHHSPINEISFEVPFLSDGTHQVDLILKMNLFSLFERKSKISSSFIVDTQAPSINFSRFNGIIASSHYHLYLLGKTEPQSRIRTTLNTRQLPLIRADSQGNFKLALFSLNDRNSLKLKISDLAGNKSERDYELIVDIYSPKIKETFPFENSKVFGDSLELSVQMEDLTSDVAEVTFIIDGIELKGNYDRKLKRATCKLDLKKDGQHRVKVRVCDLAGNSDEKEWSFWQDTTKIVIKRSQRKLYLYHEGNLIKIYPVAVGTPGYPTPLGNWKVIAKRKHPSWHNPHKSWSKNMPEVIPPGLGNPLGPRAIELSAPLVRIHGTPHIWSVGHAASHGCVRMYPRDVIELFEQVSVGTPVYIIP